MRTPVLWGSILSSIILASVIYFTSFPEITFFENAYSSIASLPHITPYFLAITIAFGTGLYLFLALAFIAVNRNTLKVRTILITAYFSGTAMILTPYDKNIFGLWFSHTLFAFILTILIVLLAYEFAKVRKPKTKIIAWLQRYLPPAMGTGTLALFIISGINMLMETYFFTLTSIWLLVVGLVVKERKD